MKKMWIAILSLFALAAHPSHSLADEKALIQQIDTLELKTFGYPQQAGAELFALGKTIDRKVYPLAWLHLQAYSEETTIDDSTLDQWLSEAEGLKDDNLYLRLLMKKARTGMLQSRPRQEVLASFEKGIALCKMHPNPLWCGRLYRGLSGFHYRLGEIPQAMEAISRSLELSKNLTGADTYYYYSAVNTLAVLLYMDRQYAQSLQLYEQSFNYFKQHDFLYSAANDSYNLAALYSKVYPEDAVKLDQLINQAVELTTQLGDEKLYATVIYLQGKIFNGRGDFARSVGYLQKAQRLFAKQDDIEFSAGALIELSRASLATGQVMEAKKLVKEADQILTDDYQMEKLQILELRQKIAKKDGDFAAANELMELYFKRWREQKENEEKHNLQKMSSSLALQVETEKNKNLQKENELQAQKIKESEIIRIFVIISTCLALLALGFLLQTLRQKTRLFISQKNMKNILDNVDDGLLTIDDKQSIGKDYSKSVGKILDIQDSIAGRSLIEAIFARSTLAKAEQSMIHQILLSAIGEERLAWDLNSSHLPSTVHFGEDSEKITQFRWIPITNKLDIVIRVLISIRDVTSEKELERAIGFHKKYKESLPDILQEILEVDFQRLEAQLQSLIGLLTPMLEQASDPKLRSELHTQKGVARALGLRILSNEIHELESELDTHHLVHSRRDKILQLCQDYYGYAKILKKKSQSREFSLASILAPHVAYWQKLMLECGHPVSEIRIVDRLQGTLNDDHDLIEIICVHALSNAFDHGFIQPRARGEPAALPVISILGERHNGNLALTIEDNGQGINISKLQILAEKRGFVVPDGGSLTDIVFETGLSTSDQLTRISGRGVGLAAAKMKVKERGGGISLQNREAVRGTILQARWPIAYKGDP